MAAAVNPDSQYFQAGDVVGQKGYNFTALTTGTAYGPPWVISNAY